jgi:hypothetical protein
MPVLSNPTEVIEAPPPVPPPAWPRAWGELLALLAEVAGECRAADGAEPAQRLGLAPDADGRTVSAALSEALARWQRRAENPLASGDVVDAARVVVRTCEGMAATLAEEPTASPPP